MAWISSCRPYGVLALGFAIGAPLSSWACATCGCTLSADGALGYALGPGWRINFEYDYINQDELRRGMHTATPQQVVDVPSLPRAWAEARSSKTRSIASSRSDWDTAP